MPVTWMAGRLGSFRGQRLETGLPAGTRCQITRGHGIALGVLEVGTKMNGGLSNFSHWKGQSRNCLSSLRTNMEVGLEAWSACWRPGFSVWHCMVPCSCGSDPKNGGTPVSGRAWAESGLQRIKW